MATKHATEGIGTLVIVQKTSRVQFTLQHIQHEADFCLLRLDNLYIGSVSLKRLRFTPGELSSDQTAVIIGQYKKYRRGANFVDGLDTVLSVTSVGLVATGVWLLSSIIAVPVALGLQVRAIGCGLLGAGGKLIGRRLQAKARKHDLIRDLAESKLSTIADCISTVLTDNKITEEELCLIISEIDKYNQMKAEILGRPKQSGGLSEDEKKQAISACERRNDNIRRDPSWNQQWHLSISCWRT